MAKHKAIILLTIEVSDVLDTGEVSAHLVKPDELSQYGLKRHMVVSVDGDNKDDCLRKLKEKIDGFKQQ